MERRICAKGRGERVRKRAVEKEKKEEAVKLNVGKAGGRVGERKRKREERQYSEQYYSFD